MTGTPLVASVWVNSSRDAYGLPKKPKPKVWLKVAPPSGDVRWTNCVAFAAASAVVVKTSRIARATYGMVVATGKRLS